MMFARQENIVNMHDHARPQPRDDLEEQVLHVAADRQHVRGVDEEDVIAPELLEKLQRDILCLFLDQS